MSKKREEERKDWPLEDLLNEAEKKGERERKGMEHQQVTSVRYLYVSGQIVYQVGRFVEQDGN